MCKNWPGRDVVGQYARPKLVQFHIYIYIYIYDSDNTHFFSFVGLLITVLAHSCGITFFFFFFQSFLLIFLHLYTFSLLSDNLIFLHSCILSAHSPALPSRAVPISILYVHFFKRIFLVLDFSNQLLSFDFITSISSSVAFLGLMVQLH